MVEQSTYERLAARFETHQTRKQGGQDLIYLTGEQVISRLNDVLGVTGWSFRVVREGATEVEAWVLGELVAVIDGDPITRQHYGNQDLKRGQYPTADLFKSATTDALKKAATTVGVGLYLYDADERRELQAEMAEARRPAPRAPLAPGRGAANATDATGDRAAAPTQDARRAAPSSSSTAATTAPPTVEPTPSEEVRAREMVGAEATLERWSRLVKEAERVKLPTLATVKAIAPNAIRERQLRSYADKLEARLGEFSKEREAVA
jgi:hypothetical protein